MSFDQIKSLVNKTYNDNEGCRQADFDAAIRQVARQIGLSVKMVSRACFEERV